MRVVDRDRDRWVVDLEPAVIAVEARLVVLDAAVQAALHLVLHDAIPENDIRRHVARLVAVE